MSELLTIDEAITGGSNDSAEAEVYRPALAARFTPGLNLPLAGALFLHLALLLLALLAPRLGGKAPERTEVYPIRLYSVAEMPPAVSSTPAEQPALPVRRVTALPVAPAALPPVSPQIGSRGPEMVPTMAVVVAEGAVSVAPIPVVKNAAPVTQASAGSGGAAAAGNDASSITRGAGAAVAPTAAPATGVVATTVAAPVASPVVLAHPLYRDNPQPAYPPQARRRGLEGTVVLAALVTREGTVGDLTLHQSSGHSLLDEAAIKSVSGWRFVPGRRGEELVAMQVLVPVRFGLR